MAVKSAIRTMSALALGIGVLLSASPAHALPRCVNTAANTTQCETTGSAQISTHPGAWSLNYTWPGYTWPGLFFGF